MHFSKLGIALIVLLLGGTSYVLSRTERSAPVRPVPQARRLGPQTQQSAPQTQQSATVEPERNTVEVPANTTVWVCDCLVRDENAYLVRRLITTTGKVVHETVLERFTDEFTTEYKMTACLEMLRETALCR